MTEEQSRNSRYRYDLDGLRGIAIALVVIYHVFVGRVSGGVDVFLLLSGYFFLGSQLRYAAKPKASLNPWWPIWRTLRRLLPALILVIGITMTLVAIFAPQLMSTEMLQQVTATMLYYQNWELARQDADYTAAAADTSPLQHMWSMAVQGQFYIIGIFFAILLIAIMRRRPEPSGLSQRPFPTVNQIAAPVLLIATVASFAYASRFGLYSTPENYYSTWSRLWELTLGALLAIYATKINLPRRLADAFGVIGLLMLIFTGALIADSTAFPGPLSLLPLGGAVLIVLGGNGSVAKFMSSKVARWMGDIAYPLYLWHWPLLILSTSAFGLASPPWWMGAIIIVVSLILADITHRFVELPLRQRRKRPLSDDMPVNKALSSLKTRPGVFRAVGGGIVTLGVIAMLALQPVWLSTLDNSEESLDPELYPGVMALFGEDVPEGVPYQPDPILVGSMLPPISMAHCFVTETAPSDYFPETDKDGNPCIFGDPEADFEVYLVGGSHSEQWSSGLDRLGREMGFKIVPLLRQDCPIEIGDSTGVTPACADWGELATKRIVAAKPDLVISNTTRPQGSFGHGPDIVPAGYIGFWDELAANNIPFLGLRDNPWGFDDEGMAVEFDQCYVATEDEIGCGMKRDDVYQEIDPAAPILANYDNMISVDTSDWFCDGDVCPVVIGNTMVYRDMHHISNAYAESAMPLLRDYISRYMSGEEIQQELPEGAPELNEEDLDPNGLYDDGPAADVISPDATVPSPAAPGQVGDGIVPQFPAPYNPNGFGQVPANPNGYSQGQGNQNGYVQNPNVPFLPPYQPVQ